MMANQPNKLDHHHYCRRHCTPVRWYQAQAQMHEHHDWELPPPILAPCDALTHWCTSAAPQHTFTLFNKLIRCWPGGVLPLNVCLYPWKHIENTLCCVQVPCARSQGLVMSTMAWFCDRLCSPEFYQEMIITVAHIPFFGTTPVPIPSACGHQSLLYEPLIVGQYYDQNLHRSNGLTTFGYSFHKVT